MQRYAKEAVLACLEARGSASDDAIIDYACEEYPLTQAERADKTPNGKRNLLRSLTGVAIAELKKEKTIEETSGEYYLTKEMPVIVREEQCEKETLQLLSKTSMTKAELFVRLGERMGTDKTRTKTDDATLRSVTGTILKRLTQKGQLTLSGGRYTLVKPSNTATKASYEGEADVKKAFLTKLHGMGGAFFERFFMNLLDCYYKSTGKTVRYCQVVGGSEDGGIDGIIETVDDLGFREQTMVQTKCRGENHVTEKEVREFYGALCAKNGSRGIYATTSTFHYGALKFLSKIDNCVGVDGDRLFSIAQKCRYGVKKSKNGYILDDSAFL